MTEELAIVQTVDYITPIVDDPYWTGAIAAANSLSDIYAMGARPLIALNIVGFPAQRLPLAILQEILKGGAEKAKEAGVLIVGGHTIDDNEPKYGLVVTGVVHPGQVVTNAGGKVGDDLLLTKPLGMGIISTAVKRGRAEEETIRKAVEIMSTLNKAAAEVMVEVGVHAATDVTGFGLLGHLYELTRASRVGARISFQQVPVLPEVWDLAREGLIPGGTKRNLKFLTESEAVRWATSLDEVERLVLADAQTSGGLLIAVPKERSVNLLARLEKAGVSAKRIGELVEDLLGRITVEE